MKSWLQSKSFNSIPFIGIPLFAALYIYAASIYPGGSQANLNTVGFDWVHNYWCNLTNEFAMNETLNPARPIAVAALIILCLGIMTFFIQFAFLFTTSRTSKTSILFGGIFSMLSAVLIFTDLHDTMTIVSSVFGLVALIGVLVEMYKSQLTFYKLTGAFCVLLLAANNYIYYTQNGIEGLPLLQKISFAFVLLWILGMNLKIRSKISE